MSNRTISKVALAALALALLAPGVAAAQQDRNLTLDTGEQTTISAVGVERFSEGAPGIVDVRVTPAEFIVVALRPGSTSLLLIYAGGRQVRYGITVRDPDAVIVRPGTVDVRENIRLDLYFVELNESYGHQIGLAFPGTIGGNAGTAQFQFNGPLDSVQPTINATVGLVDQVLPRIDLAQNSGWARLRRQAMVVTANGTPARFNAGGEVNIRVAAGFSVQIRTITFGSQLEMTPRFDSQTGRIEVAIEADISELTEPAVPGDPPGRRRTEIESIVNLEPGQAMMLSGVDSRSEEESQGGLPGLSQIPIIGVLFGTNQRRGQATQNVLFVVPTIVQSVPRRQRDYIREAYENFSRFSGWIHEYEMFERNPPGYGRDGGRGTPATGPRSEE